MTIAIIVHGGAGDIKPEQFEAARAGCKKAAQRGWAILQEGGSSLDAVEIAVRALEDNPNFNAGTGACLSIEGNIELDAGIMDGQRLQVGAVANIELIKNPISLARQVLESPHTMLASAGAQRFAQERGIEACSYEDLLTERQYIAWKEGGSVGLTVEVGQQQELPIEEKAKRHGTVGAVAIDSEGHLAAATSTGGILNKYPGRVGDAPLVGCGYYADEYAAISCTGYGEDFTRLTLAQRAARFAEAPELSAQAAAENAIAFLGNHATGTGGLILVNARGEIGYAWNSEHMAYAYQDDTQTEAISGI